MAFSVLEGCGSDSGTTTTAAPAETTTKAAQAETTKANNDTPATTAPAETTPEETEPVPAEPAELRMSIDFEPTTLDPHNSQDDVTIKLILLSNEGLVRNRGGSIVPGIAESWEISEDGLEYTFHLRESKWADGTELTAEDFVYAFRRIVDPNQAYQQAEGAYLVLANAMEYHTGKITDVEELGVKAIDDHTLYVKAVSPGTEMLYTLAGADWIPIQKSVADPAGPAYGTEAQYVSNNGPYKITAWEHQSKVVLEKNENYWDKDNIHLDKITGFINATGQTAADMMLAGDLDYMTTTNSEIHDQLVEAGFKSFSYTSSLQCLLTGGSNTGLDVYFENEHFIKAMNLAINRKAITDTLYKGGIPASRISWPTMKGVDKPFVEEYPYEAWSIEGEPEKAKAEMDLALQELGKTIDEVPEICVLCYESEKNLLLIQAMQDMYLKTLGIKLTIEPLPIQAMFSKVFSNDFDLWWSGMSIGSQDWGSPDGFLSSFDWRNEGYTGSWKDEEFARLYDIVKTTGDLKERKDALFEIEKILCEQHPPFLLAAYTQAYICYSPDYTDPELARYDDITYMMLK